MGSKHYNKNYVIDCQNCDAKFFCSVPNAKFCEACKPLVRRADERARYHRMKEYGLCVICEKGPPVEGKVMCESCNEIHRDRTYERRQKAVNNRQCRNCYKPHNRTNRKGEPVLLCEACTKAETDRNRVFIDNRKSENLCYRCGVDVEPGEGKCKQCRKEHTNYIIGLRKKRISEGTCVHCNRPSYNGRVMCELHTLIRREYLRLYRVQKRYTHLFKLKNDTDDPKEIAKIDRKLLKLAKKDAAKKIEHQTALDTFYSKEKRNG